MMTIHKLHAGDGYVYLTRHVEPGDATEQTRDKINDYYNAKGSPAGKWHGRLTAAAGVATGETVTEEHMIDVFGGAWKPNRKALAAALRAQHKTDAEISRETALGRPFPSFNNSAALIEGVQLACAQIKRDTGEYPDAQTQLQIKRDVATAILSATTRADLLSEADLDAYIAESYSRARHPVAGYDLVFTPVKSISLLWGLGDPGLKELVERAHREAVDEALAWIEDEVAYTRRGAGGARQIRAEGLLIARFDHWDNRAGDANLHTHAAVVNRVLAEKAWTTIDGRVLYRAAVAASELYNSLIADKLSHLLGVTFTAREVAAGKQPVYEVDGIPVELIEEFSRRQAIELRQAELAAAYRDLHGVDPPKNIQYRQAQQATLDTRNAKNPPRTLAELRAEWRARAHALIGSLPTGDLPAGISPAHPLGAVSTSGDRRLLYTPDMLGDIATTVLDTLSRRRGTWTGFTIAAEVRRTLRAYRFDQPGQLTAHADAITATVRDTLSRPVHVELAEAPDRVADHETPTHQRLHTQDKSQLVYTSEQVLAAEQAMRDAATTASPLTVSSKVIADRITTHERDKAKTSKNPAYRLDDGQRAMIDHLLRAATLVAVATGAAGTGKSTAAAVVARVWESTGATVIALGPSARAAEVLGEEIGVEGRTIADVLTRAAHDLPTGINAGDMLLVDESGMGSARDLADLTAIAAAHGAVVRLVGDPQQLASVEASGVLRDLAERTDAPFMSAIHRFTGDPEEAAITLRLRDGDGSVLGWYEDRGRIRTAMRDELTNTVFADYIGDHDAGIVSVMIAPTNELVRELNEKAALHYRATGTVTGRETELADTLTAAVGDTVVTRKNTSKYQVNHGPGRRRSRIKNGDLWTVTAVGRDGSLRLRNQASSGEVHLPPTYVTRYVEMGYALTVHRSQGLTVQRCRVLADANAMDRQALYVAMTRGRGGNFVYAAHDELPDYDFEHRPEPHPGARATLEAIIERDGSQRTALEQMERAAALARSLPEQIHTYRQALFVLYDDYTRAQLAKRLTDDQLDSLTAASGWAEVVTAIVDTESRGLPVRDLLPAAITALRHTGAAAGFDDDDNSPARVFARALTDARTHRPRRYDDYAHLGVATVSPTAAANDPELAAFVRALGRRMLTDLHAAADQAERDRPAWVLALPDPGADPRRRALFHEALTRITAHRLRNTIDDTDPDPLTGLPDDGPVAKLLTTLSAPIPAANAYAALTHTALTASRRAAAARLRDARHLADQADTDHAAACTRPHEARARAYLADLHDQAAAITAAWAADTHLQQLRAAPNPDPAALAAAETAARAAAAAAPPPERWEAVEFAAAHTREAEQRIVRAIAADDDAITATRAAADRLHRGRDLQVTLLACIDDEIHARTGHAAAPAGGLGYNPGAGL